MAPEDHERLTTMRAVAEQYPRAFHDYAFLLRMMDARVTELLSANNQLLAERDAAQAEAAYYQSSVDFLLRHNGVEAMRRLETENSALAQDAQDARHAMHVAQARAEVNEDRAAQAVQDKPIVEAARKWAQSIHTLRRAMRVGKDGKKGEVYRANQAYTETHLALLALMADTTG